MKVNELMAFLGWCLVLNYSLLLIWFLLFSLAHDWLHNLHSKWFKLTAQQFDLANYCAIGLFKLLVFVFNLAPYLALLIVY